MPRGESSFKVVRWVLGSIAEAMPRLRKSLTGVFIGTPSDNAADIQGNGGGVPACGVAWAVDPDTHGGAMFIVADSFPAEYVHDEKRVYMLDSLGKRHAGARPLIVGKNVEIAAGVMGDTQGTVSRGAEFGDAKRGGVKLGNNVFYPASGQLIAHHLQPDPPKLSSQVYDADGRKAGIHSQWRVIRWVKQFCQGATGAAEKIFAVALNFTRNGDGTAAHGIASFRGGVSATLSHEAGGPLSPADDGQHILGQTPEGLIHSAGTNISRELKGDTAAGIIYSPEEFINTQWENGSKGPFVKRVEFREDFNDSHANACGKKAKGKKKWQTWADFNTYPDKPKKPKKPDDDDPPPIDGEPKPKKPITGPKNKDFVNATIDTPEHRLGPPVTATPNEIGVPSEYGEPVPGTPEPRVPVPEAPQSEVLQFLNGHNFTEAEWQKQGRVGHSVYAPVYKSNTAGAGSTAAQRWPVSYTSEGKLYVAANGRVLAIERPYYASGAKITLAPEMERQHQFVANKETWPTTLSAFYTIFGAGKNVAGTEFIGGFGIGLRVPNTYKPASGWYFKLDYTDGHDVPDLDIRSTDSAGLDASTGRVVKINGTAISSGSGDFVGPSASIAESIVAFDGTTGKLGKQGRMMFGTPSVGPGDTADSETLKPMRPVLSSGHGINAIIQGQPGTVGDSDGGGVFILAAAGSGFGAAGTVGVGNSGSLKEVLIGQSGKTTTISGNFALPDDDVQVSEGGTGASTAPGGLSNLGGFGTPIALANLAMM